MLKLSTNFQKIRMFYIQMYVQIHYNHLKILYLDLRKTGVKLECVTYRIFSNQQVDMTSYDAISVLDQQECVNNDLVIFLGYIVDDFGKYYFNLQN